MLRSADLAVCNKGEIINVYNPPYGIPCFYIEKMLYQKLMIPGAYKEVYCRCSKKNCWCSNAKGHPYRRITWSEEGRSRTKSISEKNIRWIKEVTQNYRNFKEGQKQIKEYEERLKKLFGKHFKEIIKQTRMKKEYN